MITDGQDNPESCIGIAKTLPKVKLPLCPNKEIIATTEGLQPSNRS